MSWKVKEKRVITWNLFGKNSMPTAEVKTYLISHDGKKCETAVWHKASKQFWDGIPCANSHPLIRPKWWANIRGPES